MSVMGRASWDEWISEYAQGHQHPMNRLMHTIGIPMIALSIIGVPFAFVVPGLWALLVTLFVVVDPVGLAPTFLAVTQGLSEKQRRIKKLVEEGYVYWEEFHFTDAG